MPLTPNWSIFYRDTSTPASLETESALQATSVESALNGALTNRRQIQTFRWANATERAVQTGMVAGDIGYQIDTTAVYQYTGAAWTAYMPGDKAIVPTSVTGGTTTGRGLVTSASVALVRLNGILTTGAVTIAYDVTTSAASGVNIRLAAAGTDSTTGYDTQLESTVNATYAAAQTPNAGSMTVSGVALAGRHVGSITIWGGAAAVATMATSESWASANPMTTSSGRYRTGLNHRSASAYDGISFAASAGNVQVNSITVRALGA